MSELLALVAEGMVDAVLMAAGESNPKTIRITFSEEDEQVLQVVFQASRE